MLSQRDYLFYLQPTYCSLNVNAHQGIMLRQGSVLGYYYYELEKNDVQRCHWETTLRWTWLLDLFYDELVYDAPLFLTTVV